MAAPSPASSAAAADRLNHSTRDEGQLQHKNKKRKLSPTTTTVPTASKQSRDDILAKDKDTMTTIRGATNSSQREAISTPNKTKKHKPQRPRSKSSRLPASSSSPSGPYTLSTATALPSDDQDGHRALQVLSDTLAYNVQIQSVLSSSKMQKKVSSALRHLLPPPNLETHPMKEAEVTATGEKSSPARVVVLRARAADAGKLVSIAEIAKREIEKGTGGQGGGSGGAHDGIWYQYIALGEELEQRERSSRSTTSKRVEKGGVSIIEETVLDGPNRDESHLDRGEEEQDEEDDDFEIMKTRFERAIEGKPLTADSSNKRSTTGAALSQHDQRPRLSRISDPFSPHSAPMSLATGELPDQSN
ncbi:uncharacterized protein B0I36DRAFT_348935 [Microdochium trichocladiopsis]|uniref:DNA/RNA-binding protein Alba-like domain-containing protein n=1 Tax=Microdochium trichocladiopsis TaxID=1682393 RepID=A0A9P8Y5W1_9PEZI|nr:uncharacterized protein B0I36DRAFT_348935 [Microdochium trichocladiopsis]KAH7030745.1 hypothetical protein B0I36DRAFT_348935 [Microdochium trichocladiopsis]